MTVYGIVRSIFLVGFIAGGCFAQPTESPFKVIKEFLALTADQESKLLKMQADHIEFLRGKGDRAGQVYQEINEETTKATLDSNALGVRYMELEVICREAKAASTTLAKNSLTVLTDSQKTKLMQLEVALNLGNAIYEAQYLSLLPGFGFYGGNPAFSPILSIQPARNLTGLVYYNLNPYPGCRYPI
jgi:hypothetical protein